MNLRGVANTLSATKAKAPVLRAAAAEMAKSDLTADETAQVRATVAAAMNQVYSDPMLDSAIPLGIEAAVPTGYDNAGVVPTDAGGPRRDNDSSLFSGLGSGLAPGSSGRPDRRQAGRCRQYHLTVGDGRRGACGSVGHGEESRRHQLNGPATTNTPKRQDQRRPARPLDTRSRQPALLGGPRPGLGQPRPASPGPGLSEERARNAGDHHRPRNTETTADYAATGDDDDRRTASAYSAAAPTTGSGMRGGMPFVPRATRSEDADDRRAADYLHVREKCR